MAAVNLLLLFLLVSPATATCPQPLLDPVHCCTLTAPDNWNATFYTSRGPFTLALQRAAAPLGVDRFYNLVYYGYFGNATMGAGNAASFFRVVPNFVVQFGIAGLPAVSQPWESLSIKDDPVKLSNTRGTIAFATAGPNTRKFRRGAHPQPGPTYTPLSYKSAPVPPTTAQHRHHPGLHKLWRQLAPRRGRLRALWAGCCGHGRS